MSGPPTFEQREPERGPQQREQDEAQRRESRPNEETRSPAAADGEEPGAEGDYALRAAQGGRELAGCHVELHADGAVVLVVDGERLFRFESLEALLAQYELSQGDRSVATVGSASAELDAAEIAAAADVAAIHLRPRAEKALAEPRVVHAIARLRYARARLARVAAP